MSTILSFGETLWDLLPEGPQLGGAPCNLASRLRSLGNRAHLVTRLGVDALGRRARARLRSLGLSTAHVQRDPRRPTGTVTVAVDALGNPDFTIRPDVAYDHIEETSALMALARRADAICFGTLSQRSPRSRRTLRAILEAAPRARKILDVNLRKDCFSRKVIQESLGRAWAVKLNEVEVRRLSGLLGLPKSIPDFCRGLEDKFGIVHVLVTLGERGAYASCGELRFHEPGYRVKVVDTCGSGDAFTAGYLHGQLSGRILVESLRLGNLLGCLVATKRGGTAPVSAREMAAFRRQKHHRIIHPALKRYC